MTTKEEKIQAIVTAADGRYVKQESGKGLSTNDYTTAEKTKLAGIEAGANNTVVDSSLSDSSENPVQNKVIDAALDLKADASDLATVATTGSYTDLSDKPSLSSLGGEVTLEKQSTAESGYASTYVIKQGGTALSPKINIPKDQLLQSASLETVGSTPSSLESANSLSTGDKYIKMVVNVENSESNANILVIPVNDLIDTYTADNSTLTLANNQFAVKDGGVTLTKLASGVQTSLGYADNWNSSPAKGISSSDITAWNAKSDLSTSDVDSEIESYLTALAIALAS